MSASDGPTLEALLAALADERLPVRCQALDTLGTRGEAAREALPRILPLLEDPAWQVRSAAARSLGALGRGVAEVGPALLDRALTDSHLWVRHAALAGFTALEPTAEDIQAPLLVALAEEGEPVRRLRALQALSRLKQLSPPVLQALARAAKDADWTVRAEAVRVLGGAGRQGLHGPWAVREALRDPDPTVRETACEALVRLAPLSPPELEALVERTADDEPQVRVACAKALGQLPPEDQGPHLHGLLRDVDGRVREAAVLAVGGSAHHRPPLAVWVDCLEDPSAAVRQAAEAILADEAHAGTDLAPLLLDALRRSPRVRAGAVHVLGRTNVRGSAFTEPLAHVVLEVPGQKARDLAACLAAEDEPAGLPHVLEGLRHRQARIRHRAARALGFFVLDSAQAAQGVPVLDEALRDCSEGVRLAATTSLSRLGPRALPAYPGLIRRLFERTKLLPEYAQFAVQKLQAGLSPEWRFDPLPTHGNRKPGHAEALFMQLSRNLSEGQEERLRDLCLAREQWHFQSSHPPLAPPDRRPCPLQEAAERAARAAVARYASLRARGDLAADRLLRARRFANDDPSDLRHRELEFVWLLAKLHALGLEHALASPQP